MNFTIKESEKSAGDNQCVARIHRRGWVYPCPTSDEQEVM